MKLRLLVGRHILVPLGSLALASIAGKAHATFIIDIQQVGADVVASGSGTIDTTDLTNLFDPGSVISNVASMVPSLGEIFLEDGDQSADKSIYNGVSGPSSFGSGFGLQASAQTGGDFAIFRFRSQPDIILPDAYVSGSQIIDSDTWDNTTLADLGVTPDTSYSFTWGTNAHADSVLVNIESSPLPEPASLAMLAMGLAGSVSRGGTWR